MVSRPDRPNVQRKGDAKTHGLTIRLLDRNGAPATTTYDEAWIFSLDSGIGLIYLLDPRFSSLTVASTPGVLSKAFAFSNRYTLLEPTVELVARGGNGFDVQAYWDDDDAANPDGRWRLDAVDGKQGLPADLAKIDPAGKLVVLSVPGDLTYAELYERIRAVKAAGGRSFSFRIGRHS